MPFGAPMTTPVTLAQVHGAFGDVGAQAGAFLDLALTPTGFAALFLGGVTIAVLLFSRTGTQLIAVFALFLLSMMRTDSKWADNTLVQPLETIRAFSRPLAFGLLIVIAARSLGFPRGERLKFVALPTILFLCYELYYVTLIGAFIEPFRGIFGIIGYLAAFAAFVLGLPKLMQRPGDSRGLLVILGLTGVLFIAANFFQLAGGYSNAVIQGRLTGISGNPQQFTMTCCLFLIVGCYFFSTGTAGSWFKWFAGLGLGVIGLFILWSGSRTGAICAVVILLAFFRMKIGRLALLGIVGGGAFAIAVSVFGESLDIVERFFRGGDTRSEVWRAALNDFANSPVVGQLPVTADDGLNFTESTYLRTLALMGVIGGSLLLAVMWSWIAMAIRVWRMARAVPSLEPEADFVLASTAYFAVASIGEGLMMGVLTIFVPFIYATFAIGSYVLDAGEQELAAAAEQPWESDGEEQFASAELADEGGTDHGLSSPATLGPGRLAT